MPNTDPVPPSTNKKCPLLTQCHQIITGIWKNINLHFFSQLDDLLIHISGRVWPGLLLICYLKYKEMMCGASKKVYHCWLWRLWLIWAKFGLKYAFLGTQRPCQFIWCPVGWWLWCGAVTRKTPIYFILIILISWKIVVLVISVIIVIIIDYHWLSFVIIDYHW